ncbi:MAG: hypothetical protein KatS3mg090_0587 [Patescibacteria group bacterium]|nr:MAG: hypothetical protein KatS3mg090_0587 [Patescibacteria group bacterium]
MYYLLNDIFIYAPIVLILLLFLFRSLIKKSLSIINADNFNLTLSKKDVLSQLFLFQSFVFFSLFLFVFNMKLGYPLPWRSLLLLVSVIGLVFAYGLKVVYVLIISLISLVVWWVLEVVFQIVGDSEVNRVFIFSGISFFSLIYFVVGRIHEQNIKFKRFSLVYLIFGIIYVTFVLFYFSTKAGLYNFAKQTQGTPFYYSSWVSVLLFVVLLITLFGLTFYSLVNNLIHKYEFMMVLILGLFFAVISFLPEQRIFKDHAYYYKDFYEDLLPAGFVWIIVFNIFSFLEMVGIILLGYLRKEVWLVNIGIFALFVFMIVKYFDWFYSFLYKSLFFIGAGVLLFVLGWLLEKGRNYVISNLKVESEQRFQ